ncbi:MAG TPA: hypothetical protein VIY27_06310 [Myxococcota bacterium]
MARKSYIHLRVDSETLEALDRVVAQTPGGNRSEVVRGIILATIGDPERSAAAVQASFDYSAIQRRVFKRLRDRIIDLLPEIVDEAIAENDAAE